MTRFTFRSPSSLALFALFATVLLLVGCDNTSAPENGDLVSQLAGSGKLTSSFVANSPDSLDSVPFAELSMKEKKELLLQRSQAYGTLKKAVLTASGWQQANQRSRALLSEPSSAPQHYREQVAAHWMLKHWLLKGNPSLEKQKATGFYTELMLENGNPQGQLIQPALEQLKGRWSEERITKAASVMARRTKEYMQGPNYQSSLRRFERQEDQLEREEKKQAFRASVDSFRTSMTSAVNQLEAMSQSGPQ